MANDDSSSSTQLPEEVKKILFGGDFTLSKEELLKRNVNFMGRCAKGLLAKGESIRGGQWAVKLSAEKREELKSLIFNYNNWSKETDPEGTRGNGVVIFEDNYVMWAIREVDLTPPGTLMLESPREICLLIKHSSEI